MSFSWRSTVVVSKETVWVRRSMSFVLNGCVGEPIQVVDHFIIQFGFMHGISHVIECGTGEFDELTLSFECGSPKGLPIGLGFCLGGGDPDFSFLVKASRRDSMLDASSNHECFRDWHAGTGCNFLTLFLFACVDRKGK